MSFYSDMQSVASELLTEFQQGEVSYEIDGEPSGDPWNPTPGAVTRYTLQATIQGVGSRYRDSTLIREGDLMVTAAVFGMAPSLSGRVVIDGAAHQIVQVQQIPAAGTPVVWKMVVRP